MKTNESANAFECLNAIADLGFVVVSGIGTSRARISATSLDSLSGQSRMRLVIDQYDPFFEWVTDHMGARDFSDVANRSDFISGLRTGGTVTGLCGLAYGQRHASVLFRSANSFHPDLVAEAFAAMFEVAAKAPADQLPSPTPKVAAYLSKIIDGHDDHEIAHELDLSLRAIKERKKKTIEEFDAVTLPHAVALSFRHDKSVSG